MYKAKVLAGALTLFIATSVFANSPESASTQKAQVVSAAEEDWNPYDPRAEEMLNEFDEVYERETGESAWLWDFMSIGSGCQRNQCPVWIQVSKSQQKAYLYLNGVLAETWLVSTGIKGRSTINYDGHPNGRIYDKYSSSKFPGGDYKGLGNMPFAVFFKGGFAIHGTTAGNFKHLGRAASHGCVRLHPENGYKFNRLVRQNGISNVWITVQP